MGLDFRNCLTNDIFKIIGSVYTKQNEQSTDIL